MAYPGEKPVLSGGEPVGAWERVSGNHWRAEVPERVPGGKVRELFMDGRRLARARYPDSSLLTIEAVDAGVKVFTLSEAPPGGALPAAAQAEMMVFHHWSTSRGLITSSQGRVLETATPMGSTNSHWTTASKGYKVYLENAAAFMNLPGEWYLDPVAGRIHLLAEPGVDPNAHRFIVPRLEALLTVTGSDAAPVRNLRFRNLRWQHAMWTLPDIGWSENQAGHYSLRLKGDDASRSKVINVALELNFAEGVVFEGCRFSQMGAAAMGFGLGCNGNRVTGCKVEDIGGNGIMMAWKGRLSADGTFINGWGISPMPKDNEISDNVVRRCGAVLHGDVGIFVANTDGTRVLRNLVEDMPYSGISLGFTWSPEEVTQRNCRVEQNHIRNVMNLAVDGSGLYTLGWQPGTVLKENLIHDVNRRSDASGPENIGMFFDQGSKEFLVEKNLIFDCASGPTKLYKSNMAWHTYKDNRFLSGASKPTDDEMNQALALTGPAPAYAHLDGDGDAVPADTVVVVRAAPIPTALGNRPRKDAPRPYRVGTARFAKPYGDSRPGEAAIHAADGRLEGDIAIPGRR